MPNKSNRQDGEPPLESEPGPERDNTPEETAKSKSRLIAKANHDLRGSIQVILTWTVILERQLDELGVQDRRALEAIKRATSRMTSIVEEMLVIPETDAGAVEATRVESDPEDT